MSRDVPYTALAMGIKTTHDRRREPASQDSFRRAFSLQADAETWDWLDSPEADLTEGETRFEGVEGTSDALIRALRDRAR